MTMAELTLGVSKVLIEEDVVAARVAELGSEISSPSPATRLPRRSSSMSTSVTARSRVLSVSPPPAPAWR